MRSHYDKSAHGESAHNSYANVGRKRMLPQDAPTGCSRRKGMLPQDAPADKWMLPQDAPAGCSHRILNRKMILQGCFQDSPRKNLIIAPEAHG